MLEKLRELERSARRLDPDATARAQLTAAIVDYAESFLAGLPEAGTFTRDPGRNPFQEYPLQDEPTALAELLEFYRVAVDTTGILPASGGQLGYIPGGGLFPSALGDFLADISNRYSGVSFAGPGAARMEESLIRWMCDLVGYPASAAGDLTSGGSIATLTALVAARDAHHIAGDATESACVYLTDDAHHCIARALHVTGLGPVEKRIVPMDDRHRLHAPALAQMIEADRERGLQPWLVVASAGTTDTGAVDPIPEIARIAQDNTLWFHLDAAYGGFFLLCEEGRNRLDGIGLADSIVMDPHKGLGIPYGSGAVLVRDGRQLAEPFRYYADYMQDAKHQGTDTDTQFSPADHSPELTRPFRGPRMWLPLKLFGLEPFRANLAEKISLARYFHQRLAEIPGFEVGPEPDLSIVVFRYRPRSGDADDFNRRLLTAVHDDGKVFITSTLIDGVFTLRLAVLNFRTHRATVDYLLELVQRTAADLEAAG